MAVLFSVQSGVWSSSSTWKVVNPVSFDNTETSGTSLTTSAQTSATFTPGAITVEGIAVKISSRVSTTGTVTVRLSTGGSAVAGTSVTINLTDLPATTFSTPTSFYWCYFKFASPVTLLAATAYSVQALSSVNSTLSLGRSSTSTNWNRALVTSTNATPSVRDTLIIAGEHTSAGVGADYVVTFDNTSSTVFGSASAVFPALEIGRRGIMNVGNSVSTSYQLQCRGNINVGGGGVLTIGTAGSPIDSSSSVLVQFVNSTANQFQLNIRQQGIFYSYGATKTGRELLATNAGVTATSLTTSNPTGWISGDNIVIAPTSASTTAFDLRTLSGNASGTSISITQGLTNAKTIHTGTECEIINLTRNVKIYGASAASYSTHTYNYEVVVDINNTEFRYGAVSNSATDTTTTSILNFSGNSFWDLSGVNVWSDTSVPTGASVSWTDCVMHNIPSFSSAFTNAGTNPDNAVFRDIWIIRSATSQIFWLLGNNCLTIDRCRFICAAAAGLYIGNNTSYNTGPLKITNNVFKCNANGINFPAGAYTNIGRSHDISNNKIYLNTTYGLTIVGNTGDPSGWVFKGLEVFSNPSGNINIASMGDFLFLGGTVSGGPVNVSAIGIRIVSTQGLPVVFDNFHFSGHTTADVQNASAGTANLVVDFKNCAMTSGTEISNQTTMLGGSMIRSTRHDQTNGNHLIWESTGTIKSDSTIFRTTPISLRLTPLSATLKIESRPFLLPCKESQTLNVGVWVRTSVSGDGAAFNGNLPRLICKANSANGAGLDDIVLATASVASSGSWEYISGTLPVAIDNTAFEVVVDCDGTSGWVNFDDVFVSSQNSTKTLKYWIDGTPVPTVTSQNGAAVVFL